MIESAISEKVACCDPIATQRATNDDFSATDERNRNATNGLKALAGAVLLRNSPRNNSATDTLKHAQQITQKNDDFVAQSCADIETENDGKTGAITYPRLVTCWTPAGNPLPILATDAEHEAFLFKMNPKPKPLTKCADCSNFTPHHAHGKGSGLCKVGVMPFGLCHWSETEKQCQLFTSK